ncbi:MAG: DUF262 domain-containing protein [Chloroflexi bacterium]|nr:DUF262 domain-containing protein [Chloroflexota bacterium]
MQVSNILESIDLGAIALPEFQRGYVWNRKQVRNFMNSLYRKRPVGSLLVWITPSATAPARGDESLQPGHVKLLLDGQQRITTLYGIIRGEPPKFFDGNENAFKGLMFHIENEVFEFYAPVKMRDDPFWIDVSRLMIEGLDPFIEHINSHADLAGNFGRYMGRLNAIAAAKEKDFHVEEVAGEHVLVDEVVEIFNNVNSGGTKLSRGDLALAKVCAGWPQARQKMRDILDRWTAAGYSFKLDWLMRNTTTVLTGQAKFDALEDVGPSDFQGGLESTQKAINYALNMISGRLGLDHDRVLGGRYAIPLMSRLIVDSGGSLPDAAERDRLLYWYINTFLWGRFAASTESVLNQDLRAIKGKESNEAIEALIEQIRISRGDLVVRPENFSAWSLGARFYPLLYLLTRTGDAQDWGTGLPLKADMLGKTSKLNVHHIFPKSLLYKAGYTRPEANALGNFCFLTQDTNLAISNKRPEDYLPEIVAAYPGALESQWMPMDEDLWRIENYPAFLEARRELLAGAANIFLNELLRTEPTPIDQPEELIAIERVIVVGGIETDDEEQALEDCKQRVIGWGLAEGEIAYELVGDEGELIAIVDLAWPEGLQEGLTDPIALVIDEGEHIEDILNHNGFRYFTDMESFYGYVDHEILGDIAPAQEALPL